jgi:hypothetical protein
MSSIIEKLRLIREGVLLEADDDKYDLPADSGGTPTDPPTPDDGTTPPADPGTDDPGTDDTATGDDTGDDPGAGDTSDDSGTDYGIDDSDSSTSDDGSGDQSDPVPQEATPLPGEMIPLDDTSRKLLAYKNFRTYRTFRDSVVSLLSELTETPTTSDDHKKAMSTCIEQATQLVDKLNDYILYRYQNNSYEVNYRNFMDFVVEKHLIEKILSQMQQDKA